MTSQPPHIILIGPFPPPVHGMSSTNAAVRDRLIELGGRPETVDISAPNMRRSMAVRLSRLPKVLGGLWRVTRMRGNRGAVLYMSVSGGLGQVYELAFVVLARMRGMRLFLRHCSFAYMNEMRILPLIFTKAAGPNATHITQCERMAGQLRALYEAQNTIPLSNAVLYRPNTSSRERARSRLMSIGFISNISVEKGILDFLDLAAAIEAEGLPVTAKLAGPFQDKETERVVRARLARLSSVEYVGPQYGGAKEEYFSSIDVLVFPTHYRHETEAKINHEAMRHGIPVIAYGRGCIPEIIRPDCGVIIEPGVSFVPGALEAIKAWLGNPAAFEATSRAAAQRFSEIYSQNEKRWNELLTELLSG